MTGPSPERAAWPPGSPPPEGSGIDADCAACGLGWIVDESLGGFRLRCRCGAWLQVPAPAATPHLLPGGGALAARDDDDFELGLPSAGGRPAAPQPREMVGIRSWDGGPLRPDADGQWTMRHASVEDRRTWNDRGVLTLVAAVACFWGPSLVVQFTTEGAKRALWMPVTSVCAAALVLVCAAIFGTGVRDGLRGAAARWFAEAVGVAVGAALLALLWVAALRHAFPNLTSDLDGARKEIGLPMLLFVVSFVPGVFEEIAFRGFLQARLMPLFGQKVGALVGGAAFALAHGITTGLPFHWGLGAYLSFLRIRSGSLVPGMICHAVYNAIIVIALS